ncbi:MAG: hypothetical protein AAFR02_12070, partial [Pseudomonadota bacterium]
NKRFNEAVAKDFYPCAPSAKRGSARKFNENDVVALFIYARLLEQEIPQRLAGQVACQVRSKIEEDPEAQEIRVLRFEEHGKEGTRRGSDDPEAEFSAHVHWVFDVGGIKNYVRASSVAAQKDKDL